MAHDQARGIGLLKPIQMVAARALKQQLHQQAVQSSWTTLRCWRIQIPVKDFLSDLTLKGLTP